MYICQKSTLTTRCALSVYSTSSVTLMTWMHGVMNLVYSDIHWYTKWVYAVQQRISRYASIHP
jgi:hypothetical protein